MKKILGTIAITVLAWTNSQAATALSLYNSYDDPPSATINLEGDKGLVTTLGSGATAGYVAAYWWSSDGVNYSVIGMSGFADLLTSDSDYFGTFYFDSQSIIPTPPGAPGPTTLTGYLGLTIFRYDALLGADDATWNAFLGGLTVNSLSGDANAAKIEGYWNAAQSNNGQTGEWWGAEVVIDPYGGTTPLDIFNGPGGFAWDGNKQFLTANAIPEPSTWLLLGAGAAFTVIMRRRRK